MSEEQYGFHARGAVARVQGIAATEGPIEHALRWSV